MLNVSLDCFSVIETRSVLRNTDVHHCCVFVAMYIGLVWTLLGDVSTRELSARPWHHRASDAYPSFLQAVAGPHKVPADSVS